MQKNPKQIWFYREGRFYQRRYHFQYGHFTRDALLFIFWYMHKAKMLNNKDWEVVIHQNGYKYKKSFIDFVTSIFPNVRFSKAGKKIPKGVRIMKYAPHHFKRFFNEYRNRWKMRRDERFNHFVKYIIDKFRDYCFKQLNFVPQKKKRLLYVPRINPETRSNKTKNPYTGSQKYYNRFIDDEQFELELKRWCNDNNYEYLMWQNCAEIPILDQIKTYAESDIIIGPTGTDWTNSYYCDESTLLIEVIPPEEYHPGGMCETFDSPDQREAIKKNIYNKFPRGWNVNTACKRNLKIIYALDTDIWRPKDGGRGKKINMLLSKENKQDIINYMNDHVSLSKTKS